MKQGPSRSYIGGRKVEPISKAVDPGYAAQLGNHVGVARAIEPMYEGRGFEAPKPAGVTIHDCGSQGKHK